MFTKVDDPMPSGWPCPNPWPITKADLDPTVVTGSLFNMEPVRTNHKALLDCCASLTRRFWRHSIRSSVECGCGKLRRMWRSRIYWRRPLILKKDARKTIWKCLPTAVSQWRMPHANIQSVRINVQQSNSNKCSSTSIPYINDTYE